MVGLLPRFHLEKWNITYGELARIDPELPSGIASEYGFRAFPQTYFVTISRKGQVKPVDPFSVNVEAIRVRLTFY
jgi:hypothetical protein